MNDKRNRLLKWLLPIIFALVYTGILCGFSFYVPELPREVYLGGDPIGVSVACEGLAVASVVRVNGSERSPAAEAGICVGDIIVAVNGKKTTAPSEFAAMIGKEPIKITYVRKGERFQTTLLPEYDLVYETYKTGLHVKNKLSGVGTLTFIRTDNLRFGGLGHSIYEADPSDATFYQKGSIYDCEIDSILKGQAGRPGELRGSFEQTNPIGKIECNVFCGIFGYFEEKAIENRQKIKIGSRQTVRPGKAQIYTTLSGEEPQLYDVEIVKNVRQDVPQEKSMVIHVTDPRLKDSTGGIVQGMSGSPIIQDGKLIGAITHVFINDPSRGYGVYIDWMLRI